MVTILYKRQSMAPSACIKWALMSAGVNLEVGIFVITTLQRVVVILALQIGNHFEPV